MSLDSPDHCIMISSMQDCGLLAMSTADGPAPGIAGSWQLDGEDGWQLSIEQSGAGQWRVSATVANSIGCSVTEENCVFSAGPVMSTMMMPPPELQPLETSEFSVASGSNSTTKAQVRWMNK